MAIHNVPDLMGVENDSDDKGTVIKKNHKDLHHTSKDPKTAEKLFRTIANQDELFLGCLKGCYGEDPTLKPILDNLSNFTNVEIKDDLIFFQLEGTSQL